MIDWTVFSTDHSVAARLSPGMRYAMRMTASAIVVAELVALCVAAAWFVVTAADVHWSVGVVIATALYLLVFFLLSFRAAVYALVLAFCGAWAVIGVLIGEDLNQDIVWSLLMSLCMLSTSFVVHYTVFTTVYENSREDGDEARH